MENVTAEVPCTCSGSQENFTKFDKLAKIANKHQLGSDPPKLLAYPWIDMARDNHTYTVDLDTIPIKYCESFHGHLEGDGWILLPSFG